MDKELRDSFKTIDKQFEVEMKFTVSFGKIHDGRPASVVHDLFIDNKNKQDPGSYPAFLHALASYLQEEISRHALINPKARDSVSFIIHDTGSAVHTLIDHEIDNNEKANEFIAKHDTDSEQPKVTPDQAKLVNINFGNKNYEA